MHGEKYTGRTFNGQIKIITKKDVKDLIVF